MKTLKNSVVVITGAGGGLGRSLAAALAKQGTKLALIDHDQAALKVTVAQVKTTAPDVASWVIDITNDDKLHALTKKLHQKWGGVDILIHNAAVIKTGSLAAAPIDQFDEQYRVNVRAPYYLTQCLLSSLIARQGQVVFINSSLGVTTKAGASQYAATKHALKAIADTLRAEVNNQGVRVLSVFPGSMATPMQEIVHTTAKTSYYPDRLLQPDDVAAVVVNALCLPRTAEMTDVYLRPMNKNL